MSETLLGCECKGVSKDDEKIKRKKKKMNSVGKQNSRVDRPDFNDFCAANSLHDHTKANILRGRQLYQLLIH